MFQSTRPVRGATGTRRVVIHKISGVSIHAPRTGRDGNVYVYAVVFGVSIHAPRTGRDVADLRKTRTARSRFNPRAPYGARRADRRQCGGAIGFQSTRPVRGATKWIGKKVLIGKFQSTRPVRGATRRGWRYRHYHVVSIHAPRTGRDTAYCGTDPVRQEFQSTRPVRGATSPGRDAHHGEQSFNPRAPYGARRFNRSHCDSD